MFIRLSICSLLDFDISSFFYESSCSIICSQTSFAYKLSSKGSSCWEFSEISYVSKQIRKASSHINIYHKKLILSKILTSQVFL